MPLKTHRRCANRLCSWAVHVVKQLTGRKRRLRRNRPLKIVTVLGLADEGLSVRAPQVRSRSCIQLVELEERRLAFLHVSIPMLCACKLVVEEPPSVAVAEHLVKGREQAS